MLSKINSERIPITGSMELNFRCNLRCQHCYLSHGHTGIPGQQELTTPEIKRIIDELIDEGCLWLLLTGGEPLMRLDFTEIYTYAKRKGLLLTLFTNGTMVTERIANFLAEWRPFLIEITLYGYSQETYERVTSIPGSHARCIQGIERIMARGIPLRLKSMVMKENQHEIKDMAAFADRLGIDFRYDTMLTQGLDGSNHPNKQRLTTDEIITLEANDEERLKGWKDYYNKRKGIEVDQRYLYSCGAGLRSFHIDPYGKLSLCTLARKYEYDLRTGSFHIGWSDFLNEVRFQPAPDHYNCNQCELIHICGQCPGWSYLEHNEEDINIDYLCQVAHGRAKLIEETYVT